MGVEDKRPRGQWVLDGRSGVGVGGRAQAASNKVLFRNGV